MTRWLVIFVKDPVAGRVKTRLGTDIGMVPAAWWYRHQCRKLLRRLGYDPRWRTVLAVTPDNAAHISRAWPTNLPRLAQGPGDLGQRMVRVLRTLPPGPAAIIGSDVPGIMPCHIADTFARLGQCDVMLGPAEDGGYWLLGHRRGTLSVPRTLLDSVRWSGRHAMADTKTRLATLRIRYAETLADVDTAEDLVRTQHPPAHT